jgi:oligoribonuclease (3'-5' exoribonuclease)
MIKGDVTEIKKSITDIAISSLERAYIGNFNVDVNSPQYVKLKEMINNTADKLSDKIIEDQVTHFEAVSITGSFNKVLVKSIVKDIATTFFVDDLKYHKSYALSKIKVFSFDFVNRIEALARRWKAAIPKEVKKVRKKNKTLY